MSLKEKVDLTQNNLISNSKEYNEFAKFKFSNKIKKLLKSNNSNCTNYLNKYSFDYNVLVVGVGGIGCELLKCLVSCCIYNITIVDLDLIEKSNLNRQFLFNVNDIGKQKSTVAKKRLENLFYCNSKDTNSINNSLLLKINSYFGNIKNIIDFPLSFFSKFDVIINALDNIDSRLYINNICCLLKIPLINGGTEGLKGFVGVYDIKNNTSCFNCTSKSNNKEDKIPICSIRSKPSKIQHCVGWALNIFEMLYCKNISKNYFMEDIANELNSKNNQDKEKDNNIINFCNSNKYLLNKLSILFDYSNIIIDENIKESNINKFNDVNNNLIKQIIIEDYFKSNKFNDYDNNILYNNLDKLSNYLKYSNNNFIISDNLHLFINEIFTEKSKQNLQICLSQKNFNYNFNFKETFIIEELLIFLLSTWNKLNNLSYNLESNKKIKFNEYNKDDELSTDFIFILSNIRAICFNIPTKSRFELQKIAGNIVPAIVSTNSIIAAQETIECLKLFERIRLKNKCFLEKSRTCNLNSLREIISVSLNSDFINLNCNACHSDYINLLVSIQYFEDLDKITLYEVFILVIKHLGIDNLENIELYLGKDLIIIDPLDDYYDDELLKNITLINKLENNKDVLIVYYENTSPTNDDIESIGIRYKLIFDIIKVLQLYDLRLISERKYNIQVEYFESQYLNSKDKTKNNSYNNNSCNIKDFNILSSFNDECDKENRNNLKANYNKNVCDVPTIIVNNLEENKLMKHISNNKESIKIEDEDNSQFIINEFATKDIVNLIDDNKLNNGFKISKNSSSLLNKKRTKKFK